MQASYVSLFASTYIEPLLYQECNYVGCPAATCTAHPRPPHRLQATHAPHARHLKTTRHKADPLTNTIISLAACHCKKASGSVTAAARAQVEVQIPAPAGCDRGQGVSRPLLTPCRYQGSAEHSKYRPSQWCTRATIS